MIVCQECEHSGDYQEFTFFNPEYAIRGSLRVEKRYILSCPKCGCRRLTVLPNQRENINCDCF